MMSDKWDSAPSVHTPQTVHARAGDRGKEECRKGEPTRQSYSLCSSILRLLLKRMVASTSIRTAFAVDTGSS